MLKLTDILNSEDLSFFSEFKIVNITSGNVPDFLKNVILDYNLYH